MSCGNGRRCACIVQAGDDVTVTGSGSIDDPYIVSATGGGGMQAVPYSAVLSSGSGLPDGGLTGGGTSVAHVTIGNPSSDVISALINVNCRVNPSGVSSGVALTGSPTGTTTSDISADAERSPGAAGEVYTTDFTLALAQPVAGSDLTFDIVLAEWGADTVVDEVFVVGMLFLS